MSTSISIRLKAAFLLTVFALNTAVGFACAIGLDMSFNTTHHDDKEARVPVVHIHKDGKKHIHYEKKKSDNDKQSHQHGGEKVTEAVVHIHKDGKKHIHQEKKESNGHDKSHKHDEENKSENSKSDEGNCCTDKVKEFQELDKSVPASQSLVHPIFFTAFVAVYYNITLLPNTNTVRDVKIYVRSYHPPIPDIRIAIQSFQI